MSEQAIRPEPCGWAPSVYYAESLVDCDLQRAWEALLDYRRWNPDFARAQVVCVAGQSRTEGELVLIQILDENQAPVAAFYAQTVRLLPPQHIVWYVYPKEGDAFRNFVDFWLAATPAGLRFSIFYYAQNPLTTEALVQVRKDTQASLENLTVAFKKYCEAGA